MKELKVEKVGLYLGDIIKEAKEYSNVDELMVVSCALPMMSVILGNKVHTYDAFMNELYSNVLMLIIAPSGRGGKTSTIKMVKRMILDKVFKKTLKDFEIDKMNYKKLSKEDKQNATIPKLQQIISGQGSTFQGIIKSLENNPHGQVAIYDEAGELLSKLSKDQTSKYGFTSLYEQDYYGKDLVGAMGSGESMYVQNPFLSLLAVTNRFWFSEQTSDSDYSSGFLNRFSIVEIHSTSITKAFQKTEKQDFEKFQDTALSIWNTLVNKFSNDEPLVLNIEKVQNIYSLWSEKILEKYPNDEDDQFNDAVQSVLLRQLAASLKYAMIIQIFDEVYKGKEISKIEYLEEEYIYIGMYLSERYIEHFISHLSNLSSINQGFEEEKHRRSIDILADKIERYMTKRHTEHTKAMKSELTNNIRGLDAKNFNEVIAHTLKKYPDIEEIEFTMGKHTLKGYKINLSGHIASLDEELIRQLDIVEKVKYKNNPDDPTNIVIDKDVTQEEYEDLRKII